MFEKYNLIHIDISQPYIEKAYHHTPDRIRETGPDGINLQDLHDRYSPFFESDSTMSCRITGSFDYLAPFIQSEPSAYNNQENLFLQGFCLMNNTKDSYTQREHYDSFLISYTYSGEGHLNYMGESYSVNSGKGFLIDCHFPHKYASGQNGWEHLDIHFSGKQAEAIYPFLLQHNIVTYSYSAPAFNRMVEHMLAAYRTHSEFRTLYIENALSDLLCSVLKQAEQEGTSGIPDTYQYILRYMESNYMHSLSLDALSSLFHISKYHLCREFKKYTGYSPNEYLIMLRVQHACILLVSSNLSIEEIALQSGFDNMSNFVYQIKKRTGMTPSAFRKKNR